MATITVVGLGPAGSAYLTSETVEMLHGNAPVWLRTSRHPAAEGLTVAGSFDSLYESLDSFSEVYTAIVDSLISAVGESGALVYAVPGSPAVAEHTVELLRAHEAVRSGEVTLDIRPAMAFTDLCWNALGIDPMAESVTIVDALLLAMQGAGRIGPLLITQVHSAEVLDDVITLLDDVAPSSVTVLAGLGTDDELVLEVPWTDLASVVSPDHLTSLWVPRLSEPLGVTLTRLDELIRSVREASPQEIEESLRVFRAHVPKTASGVTAAIDGVLDGVDDAAFDLEDALADLLHTVISLTRAAAEAGFFTIDELAQSAYDRHS